MTLLILYAAVSEPIDYGAQWPSAYADDGEVSWSKAQAEGGRLAVSFPHIRYACVLSRTVNIYLTQSAPCGSWASLRATEGWAALQHHTVLHTSLTVYPPANLGRDAVTPSQLLVDLQRGSFLAVLPPWNQGDTSEASRIPRWYAGNLYRMKASPLQAVPLPTSPSRGVPTTYDLFISGDYEVSHEGLFLGHMLTGIFRYRSSVTRPHETPRYLNSWLTSLWK